MARNGAGVFSPSATGYPAVASTTIESAKYNAVIADIGTALTGSIACNGESTITGNIPLAGYKLTGIGNASAGGDAVNLTTGDARYAVLSGPTFTGTVQIQAAAPIYMLYETDAGTNEKAWRWVSAAGDLFLQAMDDSLVGGSSPIALVRTGTTVDSITLAGTTIAVTGALTVNSIDVTPTAGTFTAYLRASNGSADLASVTATWKKSQGVVTLSFPNLTASTTSTTLVLDQLPAAIQSTTGIYLIAPGVSSSAPTVIRLYIEASADYISLTDNGAAFDAGSSAKGLYATTLTYIPT